MRWDFGKVYKEIRISKGLTQRQVCGDIISRSTLAKIEGGTVVPSFENMIFLLNQINMSLEEFRYICHYYQPSKRQQIFDLAENHSSLTDSTNLIKLQQLCISYLHNHHDIPIEQLLDRVNITLHVRELGGYSQDNDFQTLTQKIWTYLEKQDTWYENDLKLLNSILYYFPLDTLPNISQKILDSLTKYKNFHSIKANQLNLLNNLSTLYLYNDLKKDCEKITLMTLDLAKGLKRYDSLGFAQVRLGICRGDDELIDKGMTLLRLTEEKQLLETLENEIQKYR